MRFVLFLLLLSCGGSTQGESTVQSNPDPQPAEASLTGPSDTALGSRLGTTEEDARALCRGSFGDAVECRFRSETQALPDGSWAELLETGAVDETRYLYLVIRVPEDLDRSMVVELGEAYDRPGQSVSYEFGSFVLRDGVLEVRCTSIVSTFPIAGEPGETTTARTESVVRCTYGETWVCVQ